MGIAVASTALVLTARYRPRPPGAAREDLPAAVDRSDRWSQWHEVASALLAAAVLSLVLVVALVVRSSRDLPRRWLLTGAGVVATASSVVAMVTRARVQWEQLGLWAVSLGTEVDGYWRAAFHDDVRFVLVSGSEVSQGGYRVALLAHLLAPMLSVLAFGMVATTLQRARGWPADEDEPRGHGTVAQMR